MRGRTVLFFCEICKRELKKAHARFCTLCGKLYANVKLRQYAKGLPDTDIFNCVKRLHTWQRLRGACRHAGVMV